MERHVQIGNKIRAARKEFGMSQTTLGKVLGCSHVAISKMERGITKLRIIDLERLASALGHTLGYFVNDMPSSPLSHQQLKRLIRGIPVAIPIISQEAWLQQPQEVLGYAYWHQNEVGKREILGLRVKGTPIPPLVEDGDTVFFVVGAEPKGGNLVVVTLGSQILVKRFCKRGKTITLENHAGVIGSDDCTIEGVVIQVSKQLLPLASDDH